MARRPKRDRLALLGVSLLSAALAPSPALEPLRGLSLDLLTAARWHAWGPRHAAADSPAVVVALDESSYRAAPFKGSPTITWTREIGRVLTALVDGGALVVGFDIVFPHSIEQSELPFGDGQVGERMQGFDRDYLRALHGAASQGRLVLGEVRQGGQDVLPSAGQRIAVGGSRHIRALNALADADGVVRRLPLLLPAPPGAGAPWQPAMALELAARALGVQPTRQADGRVRLAGQVVPQAAGGGFALDFEGGARDVPTFALADLRACLEQGRADFFTRHFAGKVVLLGSVLATQDRQLTSKRFATAPQSAWSPRCALPADAADVLPPGPAIAGVYVHATGVNNLLRRSVLHLPGAALQAMLAAAAATGAGLAVLRLSPVRAALAVSAGLATAGAVALLAFGATWVLPLAEPLLAALLAAATLGAWRFAVSDRQERLLRRSFGLYLSPQLVQRMLDRHAPPVLGGEMREVTVLFSDIAGFTAMAETLPPADLVRLMNTYLSAMTEAIEHHGGYVDKFVGDAVVAIFGAPLDDPDHARHAVQAALACNRALATLNEGAPGLGGRCIHHRIGLNSGAALVGNIGSRQRFNYTAMGDVVNLASRLEGANQALGSTVLASSATRDAAGPGFDWRPLGSVQVKGRNAPVAVFEPLGEHAVDGHSLI